MKDKRLELGLSILFDMELNNYVMLRAIGQIDREMSSLGMRKTFAKPKRKTVSKSFSDAFFGGAWLGGVGCGVLTFLILLFSGELFGDLIQSFLILCLAVVVGGVIGAFVGLISCKSEKERDEAAAETEYQKQMRMLEQRQKQDEARVQQEIEYLRCLTAQKELLTKKYEESCQLLDHLYDFVGIDYQYRALIPVGYMEEFLRLKIATKLEGTDGLYYLIMQKLSFEQMHCTLQEISSKMDVIIDKQNRIYSTLLSMNVKCDTIIDQTKKTLISAVKAREALKVISNNTEVIAYSADRCAQELTYQSFMVLSE